MESLTSATNNDFSNSSNKLVITGNAKEPIEVSRHGIIVRFDISSEQEEADVIMVHQMVHAMEDNADAIIRVVADDTDVFYSFAICICC